MSFLGRRAFIQSLAATTGLLAADRQTSSGYVVGVGDSSDPYTAASQALAACNQFPTNLAGQTVVIKPNLASPQPSTSGKTTDPHVVQAIVDLAIAAGATDIQIIEAAPPGAPSYFTKCGYTAVFKSYPQVQLVDLRTEPYILQPVPGGGYAHEAIWVPQVVLQPNTFFISAAKLKTHINAVASLSMKCLVGLGYEKAYEPPGGKHFRLDFHYRGIELSIMDLNLTCHIDFAVIDGVWGTEGQGPGHGTPVATNTVLAGMNPVAVDRVGLDLMEFKQTAVPYLTYAAEAGLGPADTSNVTLKGDKLNPYHFIPPKTPPIVWQPMATPNTISISSGQSASIAYTISATSYTQATIIQDSDETPAVIGIRTLHGFTKVAAPGETLVWDGTDDAGQPVSPGIYLAQIQVRYKPTSQPIAYATARITVTS